MIHRRRPSARSLLIVGHDVVKKNMAGPGIRYWELAHVLAQHVNVSLAVPGETDLRSDEVTLTPYLPQEERRLLDLARDHDILFGSQDLLHRFPNLGGLGKPIIVDLYIPSLLENLERHRSVPLQDRERAHHAELSILMDLVRRGDFFVCATERQRDFWLGVLSAARRLNPSTYEYDGSLRRLIDIVPFGIPSEPPRMTRPVLRGVVPGIGEEDFIIYWGGGIWNWLDPLTPIRALQRLTATEPRARLVFLAGRHPNPLVPEMEMAGRAERLAEESGMLDRQVFFHRQWIPYERRADYLLEADIAVSAHLGHIETRFSFRTRLLDCIWAGLPMVVSDGDAVADWVESYDLGMTVEPGDVDGMAECLLGMLDSSKGRQALHANFERLRPQLSWERVARPLLEFCLNPRKTSETGVPTGPTSSPPVPE